MSFTQHSPVHVSFLRFAWLGPLTVLLSIAAVLLSRAVAVALLHPPSSFIPLRLLPPIVDTAGLITWAVLIFAVMLRVVSDPVRKFKAVARVVLLMSFVPDILLVRWHTWGATRSYAFALMVMHIIAWATCVTVLTHFAGLVSQRKPWKSAPGILLLLLLAAIATSPMAWNGGIALVFVIAICGAYGALFNGLRKRRVGSAAVGAFYDMLDQDKRKAIEVIVEKKAEEQAPEDAEGDGPDVR